MPTSAELGPEFLVDTSVAVALSVADHEGRAAARAVLDGRRVGLAGHPAFESFSVGVSGGAVYDALVGAAAVQEQVPLVARDMRALGTYRALDVEVIVAG